MVAVNASVCVHTLRLKGFKKEKSVSAVTWMNETTQLLSKLKLNLQLYGTVCRHAQLKLNAKIGMLWCLPWCVWKLAHEKDGKGF